MDETKLLEAISLMMDQKLQPINDRLTSVEDKLNGLENNMNGLENKMNGLENKMNNLETRIEILEIKQGMTHKKLDDMQFESKVTERAIRKDIAKLQDGQDTLVAVLEAKNILPKVL